MKTIKQIVPAVLLACLCGLAANVHAQESSCNISAYVTDKDRNGLNVRKGAGTNFSPIGKIAYSDDGIIVQIVGSSANGWLKITSAETTEGKVLFRGSGWVSGRMLGTSTTGYDGRFLTLYKLPNAKSGAVTEVPPETVVTLAGCSGGWIKVTYKSFTGWLDEDSQCGNPVTNCN
jgi:SH3-like domain-containing protein